MSEWLNPALTIVAIFVSSFLWAALWIELTSWWKSRHD